MSAVATVLHSQKRRYPLTPERALALSYSPTGTSAAAARRLASVFTHDPEAVDTTRHPVALELAPQDLVVLGAPVHDAGLPREMAAHLSGIRGTFTPAVLVVTYGSRSFGTALQDLDTWARRQGFLPFAGFALAGPHSQLTAAPCAGPATLSDGQEARLGTFARSALETLDRAETVFDLPGFEPPLGPALPDHPERDVKTSCDPDLCIGCGACPAACPRQCIPAEEPYLTNLRRCNGCGACVRICPVGARELEPETALAAIRASLGLDGAARGD